MLNEITKFEFWQFKVLSNTLYDIALSVIALIISLLVLKIVQNILLSILRKKADKTETDLDNALVRIIKSIRPPFYYFLAFYIAIQFLKINNFVQKIIYITLIVWVIYQAIFAIQILIDFAIRKKMGAEKEKEAQGAIQLLDIILKIILWAIGLLFILSNIGVNITSLVAGLGVSGIALALAVQNILKDLFSSFAIYFDKPFVVGDHISIGDDEGTVKKIGVKTTRLSSPRGGEIIVSNQELTSARIYNFSSLKKRKEAIKLHIPIETSVLKLEKLSIEAKNIIKSSGAYFKSAYFTKVEGKNIVFEVLYYVDLQKQEDFLAVRQKILLEVKKYLDKQKISLS